MAETTFSIIGMHCAGCAGNIERNLGKLEGVNQARVNFAAETAAVEYDPRAISPEEIRRTVSEMGYRAFPFPAAGVKATGGESDPAMEELKKLRRRLLSAWACIVPLMLLMAASMLFGMAWPGLHVIEFLLASPVIFHSGGATHRAALKAALRGQANMDTLISLGSLAAYMTGILTFFFPLASFSGVGAMIIGFHLIGKYLESRAKGKASQAIKRLLALEAKKARILVNGLEKEIPMEELRLGDIMLIKPGEKIPGDGIVVFGESRVDESLVSGESAPVAKATGDRVVGASINQDGVLRVEVDRTGKDTFLSQVIRLVRECQESKVPIQELADRVTAYFVPAVLLIALFTFAAWLMFPSLLRGVLLRAAPFLPWVNPSLRPLSLAFFAAIAVLVIACPCALGLATPTAILVGSGLGAQRGVLIRRGRAIQLMGDIDTVVFDKTGTLTHGRPRLVEMAALPSWEENILLQYAASLEALSEHPLARALLQGAKERGLDLLHVEGFRALPGSGVRGRIKQAGEDFREIKLGSAAWLAKEGVRIKGLPVEDWEKEGRTVLLLTVGGELAGGMSVSDTLKDKAVEAVSRLREMELRVVMLSGDNQSTAEAVARRAGIDEVIARVLPAQKVAAIQKLQAEGRKVAMVGDGINDAPALTQADVGIAIGTGTDIAIAAADIVLVRGDLAGVTAAVGLSRATFRKIKQNLFWAFFYNLVAVPLAFLGWLHPAMAEAAMALSSLNVIGNSLRLKSEKF